MDRGISPPSGNNSKTKIPSNIEFINNIRKYYIVENVRIFRKSKRVSNLALPNPKI